MDKANMITILCSLLKKSDYDVKLEAAWAILTGILHHGCGVNVLLCLSWNLKSRFVFQYSTLFPRIPVPVMRLIVTNLERSDHSTAQQPPSVKASLLVSFGRHAPHRPGTPLLSAALSSHLLIAGLMVLKKLSDLVVLPRSVIRTIMLKLNLVSCSDMEQASNYIKVAMLHSELRVETVSQ
ncbi:hypothetical protein POM88_019272 [Heracleum sosnowskyi]|uniref:Uncharacterized protein n=1 Tax=Heracleum sosnowskyi TaxID=360622 RepID=A0AAD8ITW9_9APIA|nr:hypothetical protein POM88_019272 [Heracleum sosnowskyi]